MPMKYNPLGQTGLLVSELCLGTMTFGGGDGMWKEIGNLRQEQADVLVRTALDAGSTSSIRPMSMQMACRNRLPARHCATLASRAMMW
ncbi:hypothetical protein RAA17_13045 [Komagataeibacter rhaeticus]|nr:hypothetical protein [Komagataeibacter rhaeticus]